MDIERFPTSESAKRMLGYVTAGWYDKSYVGKWIYQVIGAEHDRLGDVIGSLVYQRFIDTATWGLRYWEELYGLPIREDLPCDDRRERIRHRRDICGSINPARMEQIVYSYMGLSGKVEEYVKPYTFSIRFEGEQQYDFLRLIQLVRKHKQAHMSFEINVDCKTHMHERVGLAYVLTPVLVLQCEDMNRANLHEYVGIRHTLTPELILESEELGCADMRESVGVAHMLIPKLVIQ